MTGTLFGTGLGPGDPELMSVRADRLVRNARHVAFFRKMGRAGRARSIVEGMLRSDVIEYAMEYPVTTEIPLDDPRYNEILSRFYEEWTEKLRTLVDGGEDVVVLCEGDPFFYGSFMHLHERLKDVIPVQVVPAITGMSASWTATGQPFTWGDDIMTVVMGTLGEDALTQAMAAADALVVMKIGRNLEKVRRALVASGKAERAFVVEFASMDGQRVRALDEVSENKLPYFSIIIVHGQGRRP
ncbi:MAG: precorrin-2 C(20)-methyltransferase [Boseongicola sp.]|nr:precorrin-2 C(20)-methyltransferase [Boseongicola sp.]